MLKNLEKNEKIPYNNRYDEMELEIPKDMNKNHTF